MPTQEKVCREYCFREGYEIASIFIEEGESAKTANRTKLKELLTFCNDKKNRVDVLVVNSVDRFSRDRYAHVTDRAILSKRGITLRSATEPIDDSAAGKLVEGILSNIAQFENDHKAEQTKPGMKAALTYATYALRNAARFWIQCSADQKQNFQRLLFPKGLVFEGESYRTATTCIAFIYFQGISEGKSNLASQSIPTRNQIIAWFKEMETLRVCARVQL